MTCMYYIYPETPEDCALCFVSGRGVFCDPTEDCRDCDMNGYTQEMRDDEYGDRKYHQMREKA